MRSDEKKKDLTMERRLDAMRARSKASLPPVVTTEHAVSTLMVDKNDGILKNRSAPFVRRVSKDFGLSMSAVEGRSTYQSNSNHAVPAEPRVTRINSARVLDLALTNKLDDETTSRGLEERHLGRTLSSRSEKSKFEKASVKEPAIESSLSPRRSAEKQDGNVNPANNDPVSSSNSIVFSNATIVPYKADPIQQPALTDVISIVNEEPLVRGEETCLDFGGSLVYHVSEGSTCSSSEVFLHHELSRPNYPAHERSVMAPIQTYAQDPLLPTCVSQTISVKGETMSMEATSTIQPWSQMSQGLIHSAQDSPTLDIIREIMRIETLPTDTPQKTLSLGPLPTTMSHEPTVAPSLADCLEFDPEQVTAKVSLLEQQEITLMVPKEQFSVEPLVSPMGVRKWVVWPLTAMKAIMVIIILAQAFRNGDQADFMKWGNKISKDILFVMMAFMIGAGLADVI
ncbi:hypothetical protein B0J11DRAFT_534242 [Dendryphion nanum]|uniref:Uncharacterized protein n=1 Tax=Dendryphion nanum TaxID=256645 RepID=A0A9P9DIJ8_9PLEO|nr:hypothetical protein B0J11DRAFT_534242 [Dendryphion nanum]